MLTRLPVQENAKALNYIAQLDDARCNARWDALPELARKIEKHAPHRTCTPPRSLTSQLPC